MQDINVDEALWASSMLPEGIVERWIIADGAIVAAGDPMAEIRIEDAAGERPFDDYCGCEHCRRARFSIGEIGRCRDVITRLIAFIGACAISMSLPTTC